MRYRSGLMITENLTVPPTESSTAKTPQAQPLCLSAQLTTISCAVPGTVGQNRRPRNYYSIERLEACSNV